MTNVDQALVDQMAQTITGALAGCDLRTAGAAVYGGNVAAGAVTPLIAAAVDAARAEGYEQGKAPVSAMDRPAYELVQLLEGLLDDSDQVTDSPKRPNRVTIWSIREVLEDFGGKRHRWSHTRCFDCGHSVGFHDGDACYLCDCVRTRGEVLAGECDESIDVAIADVLQDGTP